MEDRLAVARSLLEGRHCHSRNPERPVHSRCAIDCSPWGSSRADGSMLISGRSKVRSSYACAHKARVSRGRTGVRADIGESAVLAMQLTRLSALSATQP
jgi:hypothetical protein